MLPAEKTFRVQDQAVEEHELAVDLRVEERHLRIVRGRICHSTSTGSAHQITSWSSLVRSDQRRRRKTPTRRRRYVAVCRILSSEHLLPLLTDLCLFEVTVAVTVRSIRGQRTPVRGDVIEASDWRVNDPANELGVWRRFMAEEADVDQVLADPIGLLSQDFPDFLKVEITLTLNRFACLVHKVELDSGLSLAKLLVTKFSDKRVRAMVILTHNNGVCSWGIETIAASCLLSLSTNHVFILKYLSIDTQSVLWFCPY